MLYDFHHKENTRKPNSVNATYLISGIRFPSAAAGRDGDGDDEEMMLQSSPMMSSSLPQSQQEERGGDGAVVPAFSVLLVKEEQLDGMLFSERQDALMYADLVQLEARASFKDITTIHIYSLQSAPLIDMHALTHAAWEVKSEIVREDVAKAGAQYGMIQNQFVKVAIVASLIGRLLFNTHI